VVVRRIIEEEKTSKKSEESEACAKDTVKEAMHLEQLLSLEESTRDIPVQSFALSLICSRL